MFRLRILLGLWFTVDAVILLTSSLHATSLLQGNGDVVSIAIAAGVAVFAESIFWVIGIHRFSSRKTSLRHLVLLTTLALLNTSLFFVISALHADTAQTLTAAGISFPVATFLLWIWHMGFDPLYRVFLRMRPPVFPTLVIGTTGCAQSIVTSMEKNMSPLRIIGILTNDTTRENVVSDIPILGKLNKIPQVLDEKHITHVLHCGHIEQSCNIQTLCQERGIVYILPPCAMGITESGEDAVAINGHRWTAENAKGHFWSGLFH